MKNKKNECILNIIAICIAVLFLFPVYWIIITSLKTEKEIFQINLTFFPKELVFTSYIEQFSKGEYNLLTGFKNSFIVAFLTMVLTGLLAVPAAHGLARFNIPFKGAFIQSFLLTQLMPVTLLLTPMFIIFKKIDLIDTYFAPIFASCTSAIPFAVIILRPYFLSIPREMEDVAKIDGCNMWTTFLRIIIPISYPGIIMVGVFSFLFGWSDLIYSLTFLSSQTTRPINAGIYNYIGKYGIQWNNIMAFGTVIIIPVILLFIFLQKYIISGLTSGSVKE